MEAWVLAVARAYNGGLGATPQWSEEEKPREGGQGVAPMKLTKFM